MAKNITVIPAKPNRSSLAENLVNISFELGTYSAQSEHPSRSK